MYLIYHFTIQGIIIRSMCVTGSTTVITAGAVATNIPHKEI